MENNDALGVQKGTHLRLISQYEKFPPGSVWIADMPVDLGDLVFITAATAPGQPGIPENHPETLPASLWALDGAVPMPPSASNPTPPQPPPLPEAATAAVLAGPLPWDVEDGEVPDVFRQLAPPSEIAVKFFQAYLTVSPPFDDTQLKDLLLLVKVPEGQPWDDTIVARMFYAFNELNSRQHDPIIFAVSPALAGAIKSAEKAAEKTVKKGGGKKSKAKEAAEAEPVGPAIVSPVPTGVINAEREFQGLPPTTDTPSMGVAPPPPSSAPTVVWPGSSGYGNAGPVILTPASGSQVEPRHLAAKILQEVAGFDTMQAVAIVDRAAFVAKAALLA